MLPWLSWWGCLWFLLSPGGTSELSVLCPGLWEVYQTPSSQLSRLEAVNPDLAPACQVGEEEHVGRVREWQACCCQVLAMKQWSGYLGLAFVIYRLEASILLLCCHPLRTIRPPPPTTFTELQWGEPHLDAFGTGMQHCWVIFQSQCGQSGCPLWATATWHHSVGCDFEQGPIDQSDIILSQPSNHCEAAKTCYFNQSIIDELIDSIKAGIVPRRQLKITNLEWLFVSFVNGTGVKVSSSKIKFYYTMMGGMCCKCFNLGIKEAQHLPKGAKVQSPSLRFDLDLKSYALDPSLNLNHLRFGRPGPLIYRPWPIGQKPAKASHQRLGQAWPKRWPGVAHGSGFDSGKPQKWLMALA
ncbi:hypothetical protein EI94DRAFT_1706338 [Lactarius quietus]|nr:hypothetical protein EI94DRAFT_1706338 [Lactarius quietus]